jgi:hypothetical protein
MHVCGQVGGELDQKQVHCCRGRLGQDQGDVGTRAGLGSAAAKL